MNLISLALEVVRDDNQSTSEEVDLNKIIICIIKNNHICIYRHICTMELNRGSAHTPRRCGRPIRARSFRLAAPAAADPSVPRCRAVGHRRGRRGAAGPWAKPFSRLARAAPVPPFWEKPGLDPVTGRQPLPNCSSDRRLGNRVSALRNFSHLSLSVSAFWCLQNLQRFAYFGSSDVGAVLGCTRR